MGDKIEFIEEIKKELNKINEHISIVNTRLSGLQQQISDEEKPNKPTEDEIKDCTMCYKFNGCSKATNLNCLDFEVKP